MQKEKNRADTESKNPYFEIQFVSTFVVLVLSIISIYTTFLGIRALLSNFPSEILIPDIWLALIISLIIQLPIYAVAKLYLTGYGEKRWLMLYCIFACISIFFSYIGLFETFSGQKINKDFENAYVDELVHYMNKSMESLKQYSTILISAKDEAYSLMQQEKTEGNSMLKVPSSKYIRLLDKQANLLDRYNKKSRPGPEGPIYQNRKNYFENINKLLKNSEKIEKELIESEQNWKNLNTHQKAKYLISINIPWHTIVEVINTETTYSAPIMPTLKILARGHGIKDSESFLEWMNIACSHLLKNFFSTEVLFPFSIAFLLDIIILLFAFFYKIEKVDYRNIVVEVLNASINCSLNELQVSMSIREILGLLDSRNNVSEKNRVLWKRDLQRLSNVSKIFFDQLEKKGIAKQKKMGFVWQIKKEYKEIFEELQYSGEKIKEYMIG